MCFFRLLLIAGATKVAAMVAPMCLRAQAYGDRGKPSSRDPGHTLLSAL